MHKYTIYLISKVNDKPVLYTNCLTESDEFNGIEYIDDNGDEWYIPFSNIAGIKKTD